LKIVSHSLEYLLQNYVKIFLTTHSDKTIMSFKNCLMCFGEDRFMRGSVNHPLILLLFTPEKDTDPPLITLLGALGPYINYKKPCTKNEI